MYPVPPGTSNNATMQALGKYPRNVPISQAPAVAPSDWRPPYLRRTPPAPLKGGGCAHGPLR
eukprot:5026039-Prymnesium_polylepis.1